MPLENQSILEEFQQEIPLYVAFEQEVKRLLNELLAPAPITIHAITSRVKLLESLERKIAGNPSEYRQLADITDLCGVRVTTYFEDQVDEIAEIIEREFDVDVPNSVDKRKKLDPDRFGYLSLHYVVSLSRNRAELPENRRFQGKKAEIQIRSILQHAWAEIEHDLQYKSTLAVPKEIRRRFARLAGLLELADSEFKHIRDATEEYRRETTERVKKADDAVALDSVSLQVLIREQPIVLTVDHAIAEAVQVVLNVGDTANLNVMTSMAAALSMQSIQQIELLLTKHGEAVVRFAKAFITSTAWDPYPLTFLLRGISIVYLLYLMFAKLGTEQETRKALARVAFPTPGPNIDQLARELINALE